MPAVLLDGPAVEPLTLDEAKAFLRVDHDAEDALISALVVTARASVEALTRRALIDQRWRLIRDAWPASGFIPVPVNPLRSLVAASVKDVYGIEVALDLAALRPDSARLPGLIRVERGAVPAPGWRPAGIAVEFIAGHGSAAADVPAPLIEAVRLVLAHFYEHRDETGPSAALPATLGALIAPYRVVRL
ncbi:head-tail connector protein [Ancylobacter sp. 6x-1]|uniref:Head-tail connector protein n=1 Tax=Ancylobacter crimeensis TaxID=2579147 RepID=A0ABT0D8R7_9HYPH|nr:head-tail connector protein [Ancylobacter crimeensis]MCK0196351.1 head-tail connector protein [Ancylobacter crimeensis]